MGHPLPPKKEVVLALLENATVFIHLDPRKDGVVVPMNFKSQPQLVLQIGLNMAVRIPDLRVEDDGVTCTLSFGGRGFWCSIPWRAVYALAGEDGRCMLWPDDMPPEVARQLRPAPPPKPALAAAPEPSKLEKAAEPKRATRRGKKSDDEAPAKPKRASKRKGEPVPPPAAPIRERLVAVPPKQGALEKEASKEEVASPETPAPNANRRPKRELPPYLRVVK